MHYLVTIGYETEQMDRNGNPRLQKLKYIIEAETVEEPDKRSAKKEEEPAPKKDLSKILTEWDDD